MVSNFEVMLKINLRRLKSLAENYRGRAGWFQSRKDSLRLDLCDYVIAVEDRVGRIRIVETSSLVPQRLSKLRD